MAPARKTRTSDDEDDLEAFETAHREWEIDEDVAKSKYSFASAVKARVDQLGLADRPRPVLSPEHENIYTDMKAGQYFDGRLPTVIRKLSWDQLSALQSLFANWFAYVHQQLSIATIEKAEAKRQRDFMWSIVRTRNKDQARGFGVKLSEQRADDYTQIDLRFVDADATLAELEVYHKHVDLMAEIAKRDCATVSREVSIRQVEAEAEARGRGIVRRTERPEDSWNSPTSFRRIKEEQENDEPSHQDTDSEERPEPNVPTKAQGGVRLKVGGQANPVGARKVFLKPR